MLINKKELLKEITECAKAYNNFLQGKNIMFIYKDQDKINFIETKFLKSNFFHLTGLESKNKNPNPNQFFEKCLKNKISENEIQVRQDGTTMLKIQVLQGLMHINKNARIIGDFDKSNLYLSTNKIIGNTRACLGFKETGKFYVPNTSLKTDIRKISVNNRKIICILSKKIKETKYNGITYLDKKYENDDDLIVLLKGLLYTKN